MATDPARAKKRTPAQSRVEHQEQCRQKPCIHVQGVLKGKNRYPICVLCVHEGAILKAFKQKEGK